SMVRDLVEQSVNMVRVAKKEQVKERARDIVEGIILDALIPPLKGSPTPHASGMGKDQPEDERELNEKTRERFREKIRNGELEDRKIEINVKQNSNPGIGMVGGAIDEASMINLQE